VIIRGSKATDSALSTRAMQETMYKHDLWTKQQKFGNQLRVIFEQHFSC
jgi:hypothetical protein